MPLGLIGLGILFVVIGCQDTYKEFFSQVGKDFTGSNSFLVWIGALGIIGAMGYVKDLEKFSRMFLVLIFVAMFFANKGIFTNAKNAISSGNPTTGVINSH